MPEGGIADAAINFLINFLILALTFSLAEEIGMRGYLLPKLLPLGRSRTLLLSGLVFATWHMPLILLTPVFPVGNKLISLPLFYGTIVAASFFYGYLRIYTGSTWPAGRDRPRGAQRCLGRPWGAHRHLICCASQQVPGGGLRATDLYRCRDRGRLGGPNAKGWHGPSTRSRGGRPRSAAGPCGRDGPQVGTQGA